MQSETPVIGVTTRCRLLNPHSQRGMYPDSKVHGADMGPIWGRQDPGGHHIGPMNFAIWVIETHLSKYN